MKFLTFHSFLRFLKKLIKSKQMSSTLKNGNLSLATFKGLIKSTKIAKLKSGDLLSYTNDKGTFLRFFKYVIRFYSVLNNNM